jgi:hypothetical protein
MRANLVIARSGRNSLHPRWLENGAGRNWDLLLCPYQETPPDSDFVVPPATPGQKWVGLERFLNADERWRGYDYIWLPDDDLLADAAEISRFFDLCRRFDATLAQPALTEDSYFSFAMTMRNRAFFARATTFVEIMAPCFRRDVLERLLPSIAEADTGWGWGLSYVWAKAVDYRGIYIFDAAPMRHTRPVGKARSEQDHEDARREWARILSEHNLAPTKRTLFGCDESGKRIEMSQGSFQLAYLGGYDYLIERDPRLLLRITRDQLAQERVPGARKLKGERKGGRLRRWWRRLKNGGT